MQLRYSPTSPFVRKVIITAHEVGLFDRIECIRTDPWAADSDIRKVNPLSKVPCLITDDGDAVYDSPVICEYLNAIGGGSLFPTETKARFHTLTLAAAGDGMTDAGILHLAETVRRPSEFFWQWWDDRQMTNMRSAMDVIEDAADELVAEGPITIAEVTIGAGLGWVDLRFPDLGWRDSRPGLAKWFEAISQRPSFVKSAPPKS